MVRIVKGNRELLGWLVLRWIKLGVVAESLLTWDSNSRRSVVEPLPGLATRRKLRFGALAERAVEMTAAKAWES